MMIKRYLKYKNRKCLIHSGKRGGLYIIKNKKKIYLSKIQTGGNLINDKHIEINTTINGKTKKIRDLKNEDSPNKGNKLFKDCNEMNEHSEFMSNLSSKNKWYYSDGATKKPRYYGTCMEWNKKQKSWNKIKSKKISDVMESWLNEKLSIECKMALIIYWFLKLYKIYGKKIDLIVKDIHCRDCENNAFDTHTATNFDGKILFRFYNELEIAPQLDIEKTIQFAKNNLNSQFGYIRSNFGYLPMKTIGTNEYVLTSPQGHNIMLSCFNNNPRITVYGPINIYEPDSKKDPEKNLGKYMLIDDINSWLNKIKDEGTKIIQESFEQNKIPENYEVIIDGEKRFNAKYNDWYGWAHFYNIYYVLPNSFL